MSQELTEALTAAGVAALVQKQIDPMLLEYQRRFSPMVRAIPTVKWGSTVYNFNQRTNRMGGGFVADGGARPVSSSSYQQSAFTIRNLQSVGSVTGYSQEVTRDLIGDLRRREIEGGVQSLLWDIETGIDWGCAGATQNGPYPQFDGLDVQISTFSGTTQNSFDQAGAALALRHLDVLIDAVEQNAAAPVDSNDWMFVGSTTAFSKVAQLLLNQQRFDGNVNGMSAVAPGLNVPTYRNVPLVKSSFLGARGIQMSTVTATTATTGGSLAAATYYYKVAAVLARVGESVASTEVSQVTTGATSTVTLAFTPPAGYEGGTAISYKVYRSTSAGTESLLGYVDAVVALGADGVTPVNTITIVDTGSALVPQNGATVPAVTPSAYVGQNAGMIPRSAGYEDLYLISRSRDFLVRPYVRDVTPIDVYPTTAAPDTLPFALVSDTTLAIRAPKYAARLRSVVSTL